MKNRSEKEMMQNFRNLTKDMKSRGIKPGFHFIDDEASTALDTTMNPINIKYQLFPPRNHIENIAERAIQTPQNHFIAVLCNVDKDFHLQL